MTTDTGRSASLLEVRSDAEKYPRLNRYTRDEAVALMSRIVAQAYLYRGQEAEANNIRFIAGALVDELLADQDNVGTKFITFTEIQHVVKQAVLKGELYGISVASLYKAVYDYAKGEGHLLSKEAERRYYERRQMELMRASSVLSPTRDKYANIMLGNCKVK